MPTEPDPAEHRPGTPVISPGGGSRRTVVVLNPLDVELVDELVREDPTLEVVVAPPPTAEDLASSFDGVSVVLGDSRQRWPLDAARLALINGPSPCVVQPSVGYDYLDVEAATTLGIAVANTAGSNSDAVADWAVMAMLVMLRGITGDDAAMHRGEWPAPRPGRELSSCVVGLVGFGATARAVAQRVALGFGAQVLASRRNVAATPPAGVTFAPLPEVLAHSDIVSLHAPLDRSTHHLLDRDRLRAMRRGSYLVNSARGNLVEIAALLDALDDGQLAGAALDVYDLEPLPPESALRHHPGLLLSPHVAWSTTQADARMRRTVTEGLRAALAGDRPTTIVNAVADRRSPTGDRADVPIPRGMR